MTLEIMNRLDRINSAIDDAPSLHESVVVLPFETTEKRENVVRPISNFEDRIAYNACKRVFDVIGSFILIVILALPMVIIALLIRIESEGPSIYRQCRLGKNGKPFMLYKFRSMKVDAEKNGVQWAESNDSRVTRIGRILRLKRLDELPQLINILLGQISVVGPRPERPEFYKEFRKSIEGFEQRLLVVPGLTGWAQVNGGYNISPYRKAELDVDYIENRSFRLDIKIIFKTIGIVFSHDGAR